MTSTGIQIFTAFSGSVSKVDTLSLKLFPTSVSYQLARGPSVTKSIHLNTLDHNSLIILMDTECSTDERWPLLTSLPLAVTGIRQQQTGGLD